MPQTLLVGITSRRKRVEIIGHLEVFLFALVFFAACYVHQEGFRQTTAASRLDLLHALAGEGTFKIDRFHANTGDKAVHEGAYYSDKAPGTVVLAFPAFLTACRVLWFLDIQLDSETGWLVSSWFACAGSSGLIVGLGAAALFSWLRRRTSARNSLVTALVVFLGSAPLPYATMLFSHSLVVGLLAVALWAIAKQEETVRPSSKRFASMEGGEYKGRSGGMRPTTGWISTNRWDLAAGHACGWALASEYTAGIIVVGIFLFLVWNRRSRAVPFFAGAVPPLLLIPAYSYACFGNPFILPYSLQAVLPQMKEGFFSIKWPNLDIGGKLLLDSRGGLLFWSPFLFIAGVGYDRVFQRYKGMFWLTYAAPVLQIIVISGRAWDWTGGSTLGPRYLAPILPLLALPCALGLEKFFKAGCLLAGYSILITTSATLTSATLPGWVNNPLKQLHLPLAIQGDFSPNLGQVIGLSPFASVAVYYVVLISGIWGLWRMLPIALTEIDPGVLRESDPLVVRGDLRLFLPSRRQARVASGIDGRSAAGLRSVMRKTSSYFLDTFVSIWVRRGYYKFRWDT